MCQDEQAPEPTKPKRMTGGYVDSSQYAKLESRDYKLVAAPLYKELPSGNIASLFLFQAVSVVPELVEKLTDGN